MPAGRRHLDFRRRTSDQIANPPTDTERMWVDEEGALTLREHDGSDTGVGGGGPSGPFALSDRVLTEDVTIPANKGALVVGPLDLNGHTVDASASGAALVVIPENLADVVLSADEKAALDGANAPDAGNVFATMADVGGGITSPLALNGQVGLDWGAVSVLAWFDASDPATIHEADNTGFVSQWDDKSGNANHATQATEAAQPTTGAETINALNALGFDGAAAFLGTPLDGGAGINAWIVCVFKAGAIDLDSFNYAMFAATRRLQLDNSAADPELQTGGTTLSLAGVDLALAHVAALGNTTFPGEGLRFDALAAMTPGALLFVGTLGIGADAGTDAFFLGAIAELIFIQGVPSPEQQQRVMDYLAAKWGITL